MKNIVLLMTDTFRWDNLGERAARPVRTPALDRFAAERATSIERFHIGSFPTIPQRTDMATGIVGWTRYPWQPIDQSGPNHIASILGEEGYASQLICDCPHLFKAHIDQAFDAAYHHRGQEFDRHLLHLNDPIREESPPDKSRPTPTYRGAVLPNVHRWTNRYMTSELDSFPARTGSTAMRWLEENDQGNPFFLWVDLFDPHEPWDPPEYLVRRYDPDYSGPPMMHPNYGRASDYTEVELRNLWAHYAASSEVVDRWIGRILEKLDDLQLWDDTIVAVLSDHGMSLGEHDRCGKSNLQDKDERYWPIYPEVGHVMFMMAGGDVPKGNSLDLIAQPADILPTLCELAGVDAAPPKAFEGRSFAAAIRKGGGAHRDYAVSGCHIQEEPDLCPSSATTPFVTTERWGYAPLGAAGTPELYDLEKDPLAEQNLAADHLDTVAEMHALFIEHLRTHKASDAYVAMWERSTREAGGAGSWSIDYADEQ
jgi:arylsulfatase A-like enzyme